MAVAMLVDNPGGSEETYEKVRERLGLDRPAGGIFHVAGPSPNGGWRVIEVWESEEDAKRCVDACGPPSRRSAPQRPLHPSSGQCITTWLRRRRSLSTVATPNAANAVDWQHRSCGENINGRSDA